MVLYGYINSYFSEYERCHLCFDEGARTLWYDAIREIFDGFDRGRFEYFVIKRKPDESEASVNANGTETRISLETLPQPGIDAQIDMDLWSNSRRIKMTEDLQKYEFIEVCGEKTV